MSPDEFRRFADLFTEPSILVDGEGVVVAAASASADGFLPSVRSGTKLAELFDDAGGDLSDYLRRCGRSGQPTPGMLRWVDAAGERQSVRCSGSLVTPAKVPAERQLMLRLDLKQKQKENFRLLNLKIGELEQALRRREEAEEALRAERERLQVTLASIGDGVVVTDAEGRVTFLNSVAERLTGWSTAEARGLPLSDVFRIENEHSRATVESPVDRVLREGLIVGLANHTILVAKDGTERPIDDSAAPIRMRNCHLIGVVLVFRDVTDRKLIEEERREADRRKDEFLAMLAHELRNPLTPISNAINAWPFVKDDPIEMERLRETMSRQTQQMTRLIDDLLDVSRVSRGTVSLRLQRTDLRAVLSSAVETVRPLIESRRQSLTIEIREPCPTLQGDVVRLVQIFVNLLGNATKYTDPGGRISVTAEMEGTTAGARRAVVSVSDTGCGIAAEMLPHVFDMFAQADQSLDRAEGGLGIGLTLVKTLVELHNGTVEAHSAGLGAGSTFVVSLPAAEAAETPGTPLPSRSDARLPSLKVLVVDDLRPAAKTLALMLKGIGQETTVANDGPSALSALEKFAADIVLLDIGMPNMDGYEVCRRIRATFIEREAARPAVVALTGYGQEEDRRKAFNAGFDKHLVKPTSVDELRRLLLEVAARRGNGDEDQTERDGDG
ncbi:MAG: ATP-binding protein [Planctomycetota bacterium]|nr:response regulator [Planctomycetaceae bacterium]MDQ3329541.1 ATP-binding protein [Planctomycetota bacterium]